MRPIKRKMVSLLICSLVLCVSLAAAQATPALPADSLTQIAGVDLDAGRQSHKTSMAGAPIVGYALGPGPVELHSVLSMNRTLKVGARVPAPAASQHVYLPPRQQYALVERTSGSPVAIWALHKRALTNLPQEPIAIAGAEAHPDQVIFSPRGESLLLGCTATRHFQVINHLPADARIIRDLTLPPNGTQRMAVSDDGTVVAVGLLDGSVAISLSDADSWTPVPAPFHAQAISFIPKTRDLAISDADQRIVIVFSNLTAGNSLQYRIVAENVTVDQLAATRNGERLMASDSKDGLVWTIDLNGNAPPARRQLDPHAELFSLRDGYTFLVSVRTPSVLKLRALPSSLEDRSQSQ